MLGAIIFFILTVVGIIIGMVVRYIKSKNGKLKYGIKYGLIGLENINEKSINEYLTIFIEELLKEKIFCEDVINTLSKIFIMFYKPRKSPKGKDWPALVDTFYLQRRSKLGLKPLSPSDLNRKAENGEYDFETRKFFAYGLTFDKNNIELTYSENIILTLLAYEISNILLINNLGYDKASNEGSEIHNKLENIAIKSEKIYLEK